MSQNVHCGYDPDTPYPSLAQNLEKLGLRLYICIKSLNLQLIKWDPSRTRKILKEVKRLDGADTIQIMHKNDKNYYKVSLEVRVARFRLQLKTVEAENVTIERTTA